MMSETKKIAAATSLLICIISILLLPILIQLGGGGKNLPKRSKSKKSLIDEKHLELLSGGIDYSIQPDYPIAQRVPDTQSFGIVVLKDELQDERKHVISNDAVEEPADNDHVENKSDDDFVSEEAEMSMRKAKELASLGKRKLARKLFKHALLLDPKSIEVLTNFGEFLEHENIIHADLLYQRALFFNPTHNTALTNRERTAPLVAKHDKEIFKEIDDRKIELYQFSAHHPTLRSYMKESYYHHVYHTVALEGNQLTLDEMRVIIDHRIGINGRSLHEHNEVIGLSDALQYLNNTLLNKLGSIITVADIKQVHKRVMARTEPYIAGEFRSSQVFVGRHIPPHPSDVDEFMENFEQWLNSPSTLQLHPVEYAALAHYRLVFIHPFLDGNGRTARLLMNLILMRNGIPPVSIQVSDRWVYYETLTQANDGDIRPFVRFIAKCTRQTLDDYLFVARLPRNARLEDEQRRIFRRNPNLFNDELLRVLFKQETEL